MIPSNPIIRGLLYTVAFLKRRWKWILLIIAAVAVGSLMAGCKSVPMSLLNVKSAGLTLVSFEHHKHKHVKGETKDETRNTDVDDDGSDGSDSNPDPGNPFSGK